MRELRSPTRDADIQERPDTITHPEVRSPGRNRIIGTHTPRHGQDRPRPLNEFPDYYTRLERMEEEEQSARRHA